MALSEQFLEELAETSNYFDYLKIFEELKPKFKKILEDISKDRNDIFNINDVDIYLQGSYVNNVYVSDKTKLEVVFELKKISSGDLQKVKKILNNRDIYVEFDYSLKDFKEDIYQKFLDEFASQDVLKSNRAIEIVKNKYNPLTVDVLPAFKFIKKDEETGKDIQSLIIYESITDKYVLSFPALHSFNLDKKDKNTNGAFKKMVRSFRRFTNYLINKEILPIGIAPGYFIDCLLSNVPDNLFKGTLDEMWVKVLNFLKLSNLNPFLCVHKQFKMFNNTYDGWTIPDATMVIDALSYYYFNINE